MTALTRYRPASGGATTTHFMRGAGGDTLGFHLAGFDAVSVNVARWIGHAIHAVLDSRAAA